MIHVYVLSPGTSTFTAFPHKLIPIRQIHLESGDHYRWFIIYLGKYLVHVGAQKVFWINSRIIITTILYFWSRWMREGAGFTLPFQTGKQKNRQNIWNYSCQDTGHQQWRTLEISKVTPTMVPVCFPSHIFQGTIQRGETKMKPGRCPELKREIWVSRDQISHIS